MILAVSIGAVVLLVATGCASASPLDRGIELCERQLQYEIEQAKPQPSAGWLDSELVTSDVQSTPRGEAGGAAYDISGVATVTLSDGTTVVSEWECFTQTPSGGETSSAVQFIDGECSTARRDALGDSC